LRWAGDRVFIFTVLVISISLVVSPRRPEGRLAHSGRGL